MSLNYISFSSTDIPQQGIGHKTEKALVPECFKDENAI